MELQTLTDCFAVKLMALYDTETSILKALPKVIKNAENVNLQNALAEHLAETEGHVARLESIFEMIDTPPKKLKVEAIRGMVDDTTWCLEQDTTSAVLDSLIIGSLRHIEHYEISGYSVLQEWARMLDMSEAESLISLTLDEEKSADEKLAELSVEINEEANVTAESEKEEEEEESEEVTL